MPKPERSQEDFHIVTINGSTNLQVILLHERTLILLHWYGRRITHGLTRFPCVTVEVHDD